MNTIKTAHRLIAVSRGEPKKGQKDQEKLKVA
jgi:hypothetical protein